MCTLRRAFVFALALLGGWAPAAGQTSVQFTEDHIIRTWTTADGLPANHINEVLQTRDGYLWLATSQGLVRFDGHAFTTFTSESTGVLAYNSVFDLFEDRAGGLWISTEPTGLAHLADGVFTDYGGVVGAQATRVLFQDGRGRFWMQNPDGLLRLDGSDTTRFAGIGRVNAGIQDGAGTIWFGTREGLLRIHEDDVITYTARDGLPHNSVNALLEGPDGTLWIGTGAGLACSVPGVPGAFAPMSEIPATSVQYVQLDEANTLWVSTSVGLFHIADDGQVTRTAFSESLLGGFQMFWDAYGTAWIKGRSLWYVKEGQLLPYNGRPVDPNLRRLNVPQSERTTSFYTDPEGSLWITRPTGLEQVVRRHFKTPAATRLLSESLVRPIYETREGVFWVGTWGEGLWSFAGEEARRYTTTDGLPDEEIRALHQDREGTLWVGTLSGLAALRPGSRRFETVVQGGDVRAFAEGRRGRLWFGRSPPLERDRGLYYLEQGQLHRFVMAGDSSALDVWALLRNRDGVLWVGTTTGLIRIQGEEGRRYTEADGLPGAFIVSFYEEADGTLWIGTRDNGLFRYREGRFAGVTTQQGLHSDGIWGILEDHQGHLWMSSDQGLFRVRKRDLNAVADGSRPSVIVYAYSEADGLPSAELNRAHPGAWHARDGRFWFPTVKGAVTFNPSELVYNDEPPPVQIERIDVNGQQSAGAALAMMEPGRKNLAFRYTGLSYLRPGGIQFRYRLDGFDDAWTEAGDRRVAYYTNIPAGRYTFRVQAANSDGVWSTGDAAVSFYVRPFFYQTWWFYLGVLLAVGGVGTLAYRHRLRRLREHELAALVDERTRHLAEEKRKSEEALEALAVREAELAELNQMQRRFFANISHEFRTPLTLLRGPLADLQAEANGDAAHRERLDIMARSTRRLERLVEQLLDLSRIEAARMEVHPKPVEMVVFVRHLVHAFAPLAERRGVAFQYRPAPSRLDVVADPEMLEKALGNLISNALKFTAEYGKVQIALEASPEQVLIRVYDTGIGITAEELPHVFDRFYQANGTLTRTHEGTGIGLSLAREFARLQGGDIEVESRPGFGTTFTLVLPRIAPVGGDGPARQSAGAAAMARREASLLPATAGEAPAVSAPDEAPSLLVVEDNADVRAYLRTHLAAHYHLEEAASGADALARIRDARPDLIVCDVMMPGMDGYTLCRRLKADASFNDIPIILLTARAATSDRLEGLEVGADDFLTKPFEVAELKARIDNLVRARRTLRARFSGEVLVRPANIAVPSADAAFLERAMGLVEAHIDQPGFTVEDFAGEVGLSKSQLNRKLRSLCGLSPARFILRLRMERAAHLLDRRAGTVSEVAYRVGFRDPAYFSKRFTEHFGVVPSGYRSNEA